MIAHLPVLESDDDSVTVDVSRLMISDLIGVQKWLSIGEVTGASIDTSRSRTIAAESYARADGLELSAGITVIGLSGAAIAEVAPDEVTMVLTRRLTFIPLPSEPFEARRYKVNAGGYRKRFQDYSLAPVASWASGWQPRFRASTEHPVVFQVDANVPSPWREDLVRTVTTGSRPSSALASPRGIPRRGRVRRCRSRTRRFEPSLVGSPRGARLVAGSCAHRPACR